MPPRVREVIRLIETLGYRFERQGKGDHRIFSKPGFPSIVLDGADSRELPKGTWEALRKRLAREEP